jgi:hypothetical protein
LALRTSARPGTIADLYRHYGIDSAAILAAAETLTVGNP